MKKRFTEAQIVGVLREADAGVPIKDLCRRHGFSQGSYDLWRSKFGGMSVSDAKRLKELEMILPISSGSVRRTAYFVSVISRQSRRRSLAVRGCNVRTADLFQGAWVLALK